MLGECRAIRGADDQASLVASGNRRGGPAGDEHRHGEVPDHDTTLTSNIGPRPGKRANSTRNCLKNTSFR
jgi:hypothetical protein